MTCTQVEEKVLTCSTFVFLGSYTPYGNFFDGQDGYWYGFANEGNSSGDATMYWIKIKKDDYSFTEGVWTLSNAHLQAVGSFKVDTFVGENQQGRHPKWLSVCSGIRTYRYLQNQCE